MPDKYDGTALSEKKLPANEEEQNTLTDAPIQNDVPSGVFDFDKKGTMIEQNKEKSDKSSDFSAILTSLPLKNILGGLGLDKFKMPSFEAEDLLILGIALYFLFSKSGDKLLAIMLLVLLFT